MTHMDAAKVVAPYYKILNLDHLFSRMFPSSNNVKHAGRYFEQFVKVAHAKGSQKDAVVKNLPASMYTSPKSKYNSTNYGYNGQSTNNGKKN